MHLFNEVFGQYAPELIDLLRLFAFIAIVSLAALALNKLTE